MGDPIPFKTLPNQRVRLRDGVDPNFYGGMGMAGNEGWIRRQEHEPQYGFVRVYIEWDKDHWAYNGAPDMWTWEGHFETVKEDEETMTDEDRQDNKRKRSIEQQFKDFQEFQKFVSSLDQPSSPEENEDVGEDEDHGGYEHYPGGYLPGHGPIDHEEEIVRDYGEILKKAVNNLAEAEGFIVIAVHRHDHPGAPKGVLIPLIYQHSLTPESELLANMQVASLSSDLYQEIAMPRLQEIFKDQDEDDLSK